MSARIPPGPAEHEAIHEKAAPATRHRPFYVYFWMITFSQLTYSHILFPQPTVYGSPCLLLDKSYVYCRFRCLNWVCLRMCKITLYLLRVTFSFYGWLHIVQPTYSQIIIVAVYFLHAVCESRIALYRVPVRRPHVHCWLCCVYCLLFIDYCIANMLFGCYCVFFVSANLLFMIAEHVISTCTVYCVRFTVCRAAFHG